MKKKTKNNGDTVTSLEEAEANSIVEKEISYDDKVQIQENTNEEKHELDIEEDLEGYDNPDMERIEYIKSMLKKHGEDVKEEFIKKVLYTEKKEGFFSKMGRLYTKKPIGMTMLTLGTFGGATVGGLAAGKVILSKQAARHIVEGASFGAGGLSMSFGGLMNITQMDLDLVITIFSSQYDRKVQQDKTSNALNETKNQLKEIKEILKSLEYKGKKGKLENHVIDKEEEKEDSSDSFLALISQYSEEEDYQFNLKRKNKEMTIKLTNFEDLGLKESEIKTSFSKLTASLKKYLKEKLKWQPGRKAQLSKKADFSIERQFNKKSLVLHTKSKELMNTFADSLKHSFFEEEEVNGSKEFFSKSESELDCCIL